MRIAFYRSIDTLSFFLFDYPAVYNVNAFSPRCAWRLSTGTHTWHDSSGMPGTYDPEDLSVSGPDLDEILDPRVSPSLVSLVLNLISSH